LFYMVMECIKLSGCFGLFFFLNECFGLFPRRLSEHKYLRVESKLVAGTDANYLS